MVVLAPCQSKRVSSKRPFMCSFQRTVLVGTSGVKRTMTPSALVVEEGPSNRASFCAWGGVCWAKPLRVRWVQAGQSPREFCPPQLEHTRKPNEMQYQPATENSAVACQCVSCRTRTSQTCLASVCSHRLDPRPTAVDPGARHSKRGL